MKRKADIDLLEIRPRPKYNEYELQFAYQTLDGDEKESLIACTPTHAMKITDKFDFDDFAKETNTPPLPPHFKQLIQSAIENELHPKQCPAYDLSVFTGNLRNTQQIALEFALCREACLLALDKGLGKTPISCAIIATQWQRLLDENKNVLITAPAGLLKNWKDETSVFLKQIASHVGVIVKSKDAPLILNNENIRIVIVGYTMLNNIREMLLCSNNKWDILICDEAHYLQSSTSQCSKVIDKIRTKVKHLILLSATPADKPCYWNLLRLIDPEIFRHFFHYKPATHKWPRSTTHFYFAEWYVQPEIIYIQGGRPRWELKKCVRRNELYALTKQFVLRQNAREVLTDIPPLQIQKVVLGSASNAQKEQFLQQMQRVVDIEQKKGHVFAQAAFMEQVRLTALQKLPLVITYIHQLLAKDSTSKFIVWAFHKDVMDALHASLETTKHILVNGDTPLKSRSALFKQHETDPETRVAILGLTACGTGLNFTYLQLTVYAELTFFYKPQIQSEGRHYRIGQKAQTVAQYLIMENTTDDLLWKSLQRKRDTESIILENQKSEVQVDTVTAFQTLLSEYLEQPDSL